MNVTFIYDPRKETETLRVGFSSKHSNEPTRFAKEARGAGVDFSSEEKVAIFSLNKIKRDNIDIKKFVQDFTSQWKPIEREATERLKRIFQTEWDPGNVTGYLTLSTRCPYNFAKRYYFVSVCSKQLSPIATSLHELIHFYTYQLIEPLFIEEGVPNLFQDFKEALSVLLNLELKDLLDREDEGYPQHHQLREEITEKWQAGTNVYDLAKGFIALKTNMDKQS